MLFAFGCPLVIAFSFCWFLFSCCTSLFGQCVTCPMLVFFLFTLFSVPCIFLRLSVLPSSLFSWIGFPWLEVVFPPVGRGFNGYRACCFCWLVLFFLFWAEVSTIDLSFSQGLSPSEFEKQQRKQASPVLPFFGEGLSL